MSVQQLTQPIVNSIAAFDATKDKEISFVVIGGAQVVANRIVITNNQTGVQVYDNTTITMKLSHLIPANTLENGQYYNIVVYTIDSSNNQSVPSVAVPFYCFSQPVLTIDNIPASQTIENGTYKFQGNYLQQQGENLDSYQYTLYDSNKNVLTSSGIIYYQTDNSLSYTFVGMSNDTAYYVELSGQTVNNTNITTGLLYFTVRYNQPSSFAICDLVNDCENGYIQISSNIVAIDGVSNPDPPIYIDDKEVDLTDPDAWVQWNKGFNIQNDFTMRVWGRKFTPYEEIINLTNDLNTESSPNKIVLKWMIGDYVKELPEYQLITGKNINIENGYKTDITDLNLRAENLQEVKEEFDYGEGNSFSIDTFENQPLSMKVLGNQQQNIVDGEEGTTVEETGLINITDVDDTKESSIFIKGNSYQETTEEINIFNFNIEQNEKVTVNDDGTLTINGTGGFSLNFAPITLKNGKTYYEKFELISGNITGTVNSLLSLNGSSWLTDGTFFTYTPSSDISKTGVWLNASAVFDNAVIKLWANTTKNDFIKYQETPTPEYPSEIETVGSNFNEFDKESISENKAINGYYSNPSYGQLVDSSLSNTTDYMPIQKGKSYIFHFDYDTLGSSNNRAYCFYNEQKEVISSVKDTLYNLSNKELKFTATQNGFVRITYDKNCKDIKFEQGTKATPYSPYNQGSVEIDITNKNWLKLINNNMTTIGIDFSSSLNKVNINGTTTENKNIFNVFDNILLKKGSYIFHFNCENPPLANSCQFILCEEDGTRIVTLSAWGQSQSKIINLEKDTMVSASKSYFYVNKNFTFNNTQYELQIELGENASEIIEPQSQSFIIPIQEEMLQDDYIENVEYHTWGKVVLTGDEGWNKSTNTSVDRFTLGTSEYPSFAKGISNYFIVQQGITVDIGTFAFNNGTQIIVNFSEYGTTTVEQFKTWLQEKYNSGNPVVVYYKLATPKILPLTEEQENIIGQLSSSPLYSGVNNIFTNDNLSIVNVHYNYTISSPSPNVPAEIITVGSNFNEFDKDNANKINAIINGQTKQIANFDNCKTTYIACSRNTTYTISRKIGTRFVVGTTTEVPNNGITCNQIVQKNTSNSITITTTESDNYLAVFYYNGATDTLTEQEILDSIKIEKGTKATPYSPYGQGSVKIDVSNKQLFDIRDLIAGMGTLNLDEDDFVTATLDNSTGTSTKYYNIYTNASKLIKSNTKYYLILEIKEVSGTGILYSHSTGTDWVSQFAGQTSYNFDDIKNGNVIIEEITSFENLNSSTVMLRTFLGFRAGQSGSITFRMSVLEQKPDINTFKYVKHQSQTKILPIQEEMLEDDYISDVEYHTWGKVVLTGNEGWQKSTKTTVNRYYISNIIFSSTDKENVIHKCNYLTCISQNDSDKDKLGLSNYNGRGFMINFSLEDSNFLTLDQFKSWLQEKYNSGNPVIVYYKLKTPKSLSLIEEQESVMSELRPFYCYEDITYISTDNDVNLFNIISEYKPSLNNPSEIYPLGDIKNLINIEDFNITYNQQYSFDKNIGFELIPGYIYTLSFNFNVNSASTDLYYCIGYGKDSYENDINADIQYVNQSNGRNYTTFVVPELDEGNTLWIKFAKNLILADVNVDISSVQLELGKILTDYQSNTTYNIYPTICEKNLFNFDKIFYLKSNNLNINTLNNGYSLTQTAQNSELSLGFRNILNPGDNYSISFVSTNDVELRMFAVNKNNQIRIEEIEINNGNFVAPENYFDIQIVFNINVGNNSNVEIYNIQIEKGSEITEYENYVGNSSQIILENPLSGVGDYKDLMCLESLNLLNPSNQTAIVEGSKIYYLSQNTTESLTLSFINEDNNVISTIDLANGTIETPDNCVKIKINKTQDEIETQQIQIVLGNTQLTYYPFVEMPSIIRLTKKIILNGTENWQWHNDGFCFANVNDIANTPTNIPLVKSNCFLGIEVGSNGTNYSNKDNVIFSWYSGTLICIKSIEKFTDVESAKTFLQEKYNSGNPVVVYYVLANPEVEELSEENVQAMQLLKTYEGISNFYTDNKALGLAQFNYISGYSQQQTDNAYISLKCWNGNVIPYFVHSNYIDIPKDTDKIFIWLRRKNNIFDLQIENLGNYSEGGSGEQGQPQVSITESSSTTNSITVTAQSIDTVELKTVRFSRDNGESWEEIITVDGLSSTDSYTFTGLSSGTEYAIRVEAININDVIGGISQIITTE